MPDVEIDPESLAPVEKYFLLRDAVIPRPIAWVSTLDAEGHTNLAPFSFFNVVSPDPPVLGFSVGPRGEQREHERWEPKDTLANIRATGEFVVNVVPEALFDPMIATSDPLPHGCSEFPHAGLAEVASARVRPPRVAGVPLAFECVTWNILQIGRNAWVMGRVLLAHADERVYLGERHGTRHRIDLLAMETLRPVARLGRTHYARLREIESPQRRDGG